MARNHTVTIANNIINKNGTASGSTGGRFGVRRESSNNPQPAGIKLRNNLSVATCLARSTDRCWTPRIREFHTAGKRRGGGRGARWLRFVGQSLRKVSTVLTICPTHRTMTLVCVRIRLPSMSGWTRAHLGSTLHSIRSLRPTSQSKGFVRRMEMRIAVSFDAGAFEFPNAPLANAGINQTVFGGQLVTLNGSQSSDPEGATLAYQWTIISQPGGNTINLSGATTVSPTFTPLVLGNMFFSSS